MNETEDNTLQERNSSSDQTSIAFNFDTNALPSVSISSLLFLFMKRIDYFLFILAVFGSICNGIVYQLAEYFTGELISELTVSATETEIKNGINSVCVKLLLTGIASVVFAYLMHGLFNYLSKKLSNKYKVEYFNMIFDMNQTWFDLVGKSPFEISSQLMLELGTIETSLGPALGNVICEVSSIAFGVVYGLVLHWKTALTLLALYPLWFFILMFVFRKSEKLEQQKNQSTEKINGYVEEILYNFKTVTAFANYNYEQNKFNSELSTVSKHNKQFSNINAVSMGLIDAVNYLMFVFAFGFGGLFLYQTIRDNKQSEYNVGLLYSVLALIAGAGNQVMEMFPNLRRLSECGVSMKMFFELKRYKECVEKSTNITDTFLITPCNNINNNVIPHINNIKGKITFKNVSFMYPKGNENVLENFTCEFNAGTTTALIGESGCGKSTIVRLLERVYKPNSGSIVLDDVYDIQQMSLEGLRKEIGYVAQEPVLFNDSIRNNVLMGRSIDNADEKIWECLKKANVYEFVNSLPQRLDYVVGVKGSKVSGGQKQRIAIARALLGEPKIVVFDEATSALDNKSEKQIQEAVNALHGKVTVILIAHRLSTVKDADNIIVLGKKGSVVEMGNHNELMSKKGKYFAMITQENAFSGVNQCDDEDKDDNKVYEEQEDCNSKDVLTMDNVNVNINDDESVCNDTSTTTTSKSLKRFITTVKPFMLLFIVGLSLAFLSGVYHTVTCLFIGDAVNDLSSNSK